MPFGKMDVNEIFLSIELVIISLTTIYSISIQGLIANLPTDMRLVWGIAVVSFLVIAFGSAAKGFEENLMGDRGGFRFKEERDE